MSAVEVFEEDFQLSDDLMLMDRDFAPTTTTVDDSMYDAFLVDDTDLFDERGNDATLPASCDV